MRDIFSLHISPLEIVLIKGGVGKNYLHYAILGYYLNISISLNL